MSRIYKDEVQAQPAELKATNLFDDLEHCIHENILLEIEDPAAITAEISKLLIGKNHADIFLVRRLAKDVAKAIAFEHASKQSDMLEVVRKLSAILEPMIAWLERHSVNSRSLRPPMGPIIVRL
jgi:hypothetical protein